MLIVQKYGGTSVADAQCIKRVAARISNFKKEGHDIVVVVSAMGETTDYLVDLVKDITSNPGEREMDMLLSTGEQVSIALLAMAVKDLGHEAISMTGAQAGIYTDSVHTKARIKEIQGDRLHKELSMGKVIIVAGFQGLNHNGDITTLGRGGSDTTAVALAIALKADICEIYTDVDGVYTADPRVVKAAIKLDNISYDEMLELAHLGAQVLHPRSVELAKINNIPLHVRSSFNSNSGTIVEEGSIMSQEMEQAVVVTGVAHDFNVARISLFDVPDKPGVAWKVFQALADNHINVDMIIQSAMENNINDISFTIGTTELQTALDLMDRIKDNVGFSRYTWDDSIAKVSIVGAGMATNPGVAARMFGALARNNINLDMISTSEIRISCTIKKQQAIEAVNVLHHEFQLGEK